MLDKLFVYGTLGPGRPNEHVMTAIGGEWREGYVLSFLKNQGWAQRWVTQVLSLMMQASR